MARLRCVTIALGLVCGINIQEDQRLLRSEKSRAQRLEMTVESDGALLSDLSPAELSSCGWSSWFEWSSCSATCGNGTRKRSRTAQPKEGDTIYAVRNGGLYKQSVSLMSLSSSWMKAFYSASMILESIVISGDVIYAISEQKLYKLFVTQIAASTWQSISERRWSQVFPHRRSLYGISERTMFKGLGNFSESPAAFGEWKQIAIDGETVYGLSADGKLYRQDLKTMSVESSWDLASARAFQQVYVEDGMIYGVGMDDQIWLQAEGSTITGLWMQAASGSNWTSVMTFGGMIYALSNDQKLSRQVLRTMNSSSTWTTAADQGFTSFAIYRPAYIFYSLSIPAQSASWCAEGMRFFTSGEMLPAIASIGARSFRRPSFCSNSSGSLQYEFASPTVIDAYSLRGSSTSVEWVLQGSMDGSEWIDLDEQTNLGTEWKSFKILSQACDDSKEELPCNAEPCPEDCKFSDWSDWSCPKCTVTSTRNRTRLSEAKHGGRCGDLKQQGHPCDPSNCPVDCSYNDWSAWSECAVSCGSGFKTRNRTVKDEMRYGGKPCDQSNFQKEVCNSQSCPVDCAWNDWGEYGPCSDSCGGGTRVRQRDFTPAQWGGSECKGKQNQSAACALEMCPVDCQWSDWQSWSECTKPCGGGRKERLRSIAVQAGYGGTVCNDSADALKEAIDCNVLACSADCSWSKWSEWSSCSASCGGGRHNRSRQLKTKELGEGSCAGGPTEELACNVDPCPEDCVLGPWSMWSSCSKTCGPGQRFREKPRVKEPSDGGVDCKPEKQSEDCVTVDTSKCEDRSSDPHDERDAVNLPFSKAMDGVPDGVSEREARRNSTPNASEAMETPMETVNVEKPDATNALPGDNASKKINLTDLLAVDASHCIVYQRQADVSNLKELEVFELNEIRTIDDCCQHCTDRRGKEDCSAFQFVVAPSGAPYCLLASGFAYNESQADSAGQWMVRRPRPSTTSTETSTTTVTTTTSTVTTVSNTTSIEVNTTSLAKTSGAPTTTSEEEQEFPAIGVPAEPRAAPVALEPAQWLVASKTESCDTTCETFGEKCDFAQMKATVDSQQQIQIAFAQAGFSCLTFGTGCSPEDCPSWGAPFLHQSFMDGTTSQRNGQGDPCFFGNDVALCSQVPTDLNHRRLCACTVKNAKAPVVGYEVLEVSDVQTFLSSDAIKASILEAIALLADVPKAAVQVSLQELKPEKPPSEAKEEPGKVVLVHFINASATCKTPQAIRLALEADARAETVNKVLKPLLAVDGPFEEVGAGSCRDVRGKEYDVFSHKGPDTLKTCKDACLLFKAAECHGFAFEAGRCDLCMEDGTKVTGEWTLSSDGDGRGGIQDAKEGTKRCWRRTDEELKVAGSNSTESILSGIMDYVPDVGHLFDSLKNLFR